MSDEEVIRRRLLIDGDGTGDDRRINVLLKSFIKWANCPDPDNTSHERLLSQLAQCEFAQKKSRLVSNMSQEELKNYERMSKNIEVEIEEAKKDIEKTKVDLQEAKRVRKNRIEYDVLAKVINEQPDRRETDVKLATLRKELGTLKEKSEQLEYKLEMRRKQFHVLISSIHSLQGMLDESDEEIMDVSLENYEDADVSMSPKTGPCHRKPSLGELLGSFQINDCLLKLIHQFLLYNEFESTADNLVREAPKLGFNVLAEHLCTKNLIPRDACNAILKEYVNGDFEKFFRLWDTEIPKSIRETTEYKILTFKLRVHFAVLPLRFRLKDEKPKKPSDPENYCPSPTIELFQNAVQKHSNGSENDATSAKAMEQFRTYLETEGRDLEEKTELLPLFALPCLDETNTYTAFPEIFTMNWLSELTKRLQIFLMNRKQIRSTDQREVSTETTTIKVDATQQSDFPNDPVEVASVFEEYVPELPLELTTDTTTSLIPTESDHQLAITPNDRDLPIFHRNSILEEQGSRCPTRRSHLIHSKSAQTRITTVATMTNFVSIGDLTHPAAILNFTSYLGNTQKNAIQSNQELALAKAHLYNTRGNYKKLKARFHELHADYHKLIGIAGELTSALENSVRGQAVDLQSMLESCIKIFPDLFRRNVRTEDDLQMKIAIDESGETQDSEWIDHSHLALDIAPLSAKLLDFKKIKLHLMNGSVKTKLLLLQALRWKLTLTQPGDRDETINEYLRGDLLGLHAQVACDGGKAILPYLLIPKDTSTPHPLPQSVARLLNTLASLRCGRDYLAVGRTLLNLIVRCLSGNSAGSIDAFTCDMIIATLQKISLRKQQRLYMIEIGLVEWLVCHLQTESHRIGSYRLEYATALLMNLSLHREAQIRAAEIASSLISTLIILLATDHLPALPYVNGALNNFLSNRTVNEEAKRAGLASILEHHRQRNTGEIRKHLEHILKIHQRDHAEETDDSETADDDNEELDVLEDELEENDPVKVHPGELSGEALLAACYSIGMPARQSDQDPNTTIVTRPKTPKLHARVISIGNDHANTKSSYDSLEYAEEPTRDVGLPSRGSSNSTMISSGTIETTCDSVVAVTEKLSSIASLEQQHPANDISLPPIHKMGTNLEVEMDAFVAKPKISRTPPSTARSVFGTTSVRSRANVRRISTK